MSRPEEIFYNDLVSNYPHIETDKIKVIDDGFYCMVYAVDGRDIFRFPRKPEYAPLVKREAQFLSAFRPQSPIPLPDQTLVNTANSLFVQYPYLEGVPLTVTDINRFGKSEVAEAAKQIGTFLDRLHQFPLEEAKALGLEEEHIGQRWMHRLKRLQNIVFPALTAREQDGVTELFTKFLTEREETVVKNTVIHADIVPRHILFNEKTHELSGLIDFGGIKISDPAFDFRYLGKYGKSFLDTVYACYTLPKDVHFDSRRKFYEVYTTLASIEHAINNESEEDAQAHKNDFSVYMDANLLVE